MADARFDKLIIGKENDVHVSLLPNGMRLHDENGATRCELMMDDERPSLFMYDRNGKDRLLLMIDNDGTPLLRLQDANGKKRVDVTVNTEGSPLLQFFDATEGALFECTLIDGETPSLSFHGPEEALRFHLLLQNDVVDMLATPKSGRESWGDLLHKLAKAGV